MAESLQWLPLAVSGLALAAAAVAGWLAYRAKAIATPTSEMRRLAQTLAQPEGERLLARLLSEVEGQEQRLRELESAREQIRAQLKGALQKIGLRRFNSETGLGGNLSFALVMLDARNHGLMITSIHTLESGRIFLRAIINGETDLPMMPEEQEALAQALAV
ncbi:MAG: DUF4446 family protein [Armatimonadota bacterium]